MRRDTLPGSPVALTERHDVALLDLDGVVYVGAQAVPTAPQALSAARAAGMRLAFVTNNASRTPVQVAERLARAGVPADPAEVVTSAQAAAHVLADRLPAGAPVLVVGGEGLRVATAERGLRVVDSAEEEPAAVVQGYGPDVGWRHLAEASVAVARGAWWVATNTDLTFPTDRGLAPGNGTLVAAVAAATGRDPEVTGKPEPAMHREAVQRSRAERPVVVGDRLDTDIEGACRAGTPSLFVLTGVDTPAALVLAPAARRPTHLAADLRGLLNAHPVVTATQPGSATCRGWSAEVSERYGLRVHRSADLPGSAGLGHDVDLDPLDPLRAACVAAWSAAEVGPLPARLDDALVSMVLSEAGVPGSG